MNFKKNWNQNGNANKYNEEAFIPVQDKRPSDERQRGVTGKRRLRDGGAGAARQWRRRQPGGQAPHRPGRLPGTAHLQSHPHQNQEERR